MQQYVYVLNKEGKPLAPTIRFGKVRRMLKNGDAKVVRRKPFTIQLTYKTTGYYPFYTLGDDSGYLHNGLSVVDEKKEVFAANVVLLDGQKERNEERCIVETKEDENVTALRDLIIEKEKKDGLHRVFNTN